MLDIGNESTAQHYIYQRKCVYALQLAPKAFLSLQDQLRSLAFVLFCFFFFI